MGHHDVLVLERSAMQMCPARWPALRNLTNADVQMHKALAVPARTAEVLFAQTKVSIKLPISRTRIDTDICVFFQCDTRAFQLRTQVAALNALMAVRGFDDTIEAIDDRIKPLVVEHLLAQALLPLEDALGDAIRVESVCPAEHGTDFGLAGLVTLADDTQFSFHVTGASEDMICLTDLLVKTQEPRRKSAPTDIQVAARLLGPSFSLERSEFDACATGDGLMIDTDWSTLHKLTLHIQSDLQARARWRDSEVTLASPFTPPKEPYSKGNPNMNHVTDIQTAPDEDIADSLKVTVTIVIDEIMLSVAEVQNLHEGDALPFADTLTTDVSLLANGKPFARGDLIRIDDKVAVHLTRVG